MYSEKSGFTEENTVVAAASILARDEFLRRMNDLSEKHNIKFPKGASNLVENFGRDFIKRYGEDKLDEVAKLHFKTTKKIKI